MEKQELEIGDILQLSPEHPKYPCHFLIVTEPKNWGAQGALMHTRDIEGIKWKGRAFLRVKFEDMEFCGKSQWIEQDSEEE